MAYSDIPWNGPTATTNVCYLDGKYIVNPSQDERNACQCFVTIASTHEKVVMIETEAKEIKEDILMECIKLAHETNVKVVEFINHIVDTIGKPKFSFEKAAVNHEMLDDLINYGMDKIEYALDTDDKNVREERLTAAVVDFKEKFGEKYGEDFDGRSTCACTRCRRRSSRSGSWGVWCLSTACGARKTAAATG